MTYTGFADLQADPGLHTRLNPFKHEAAKLTKEQNSFCPVYALFISKTFPLSDMPSVCDMRVVVQAV